MSTVSASNLKDRAGGNTVPMLTAVRGVGKTLAKLLYSSGVPSVANALGVTSVTDAGVGAATLVLSFSFANTNYVSNVSCNLAGGIGVVSSAATVNSLPVFFYVSTVPTDPAHGHILGAGDLA